MINKKRVAAAPAIQISETDADRVSTLALEMKDRFPEVSELLLAEIGRAAIVPGHRLAKDVVAMNATVQFVDESNSTERTLKLVYPHEADFEAGRISIMSLVGAGLIGLRPGQAISWPDRTGRERALRILQVSQG